MSARIGIAAAAALLLAALGGCAPAREPLGSLSDLQSSETVVVGRVELVPPLGKGEQKLEVLGSGWAENKFYFLADDQYRVLDHEPGISDYGGHIPATIGQTFFVRSESKPFYILGGMMQLTAHQHDSTRVYFPGGMKIAIKPGEKAVYIGTIQYHRNEFFEISRITIVDDYDRANAEFRKTYGAKFSLHKALVTPVKQ